MGFLRAVSVSSLAAAPLQGPSLAREHPNFVVVVVDDLRYDEFGAAGHPYVETPNIDRLAAEGAWFRNACHAVALCSPNRATLLTGQYPSTHGIVDVRIQPSASVVGRFTSGTLLVQELFDSKAQGAPRDRVPFERRYKVEPGPIESPIYTEAGPVPFSEYGYRVTLFVPGFNGSSQIVRVDADSWNPSVELSVTPARPLALRLVDQSLDPWVERELTLVPLGDGRQRGMALRAGAAGLAGDVPGVA